MLFTRLCHIDHNSQLISRNFNMQKQLTIKDAIHLTDEVWTTLKPETIMKVWNRTIFKPTPNGTEPYLSPPPMNQKQLKMLMKMMCYSVKFKIF